MHGNVIPSFSRLQVGAVFSLKVSLSIVAFETFSLEASFSSDPGNKHDNVWFTFFRGYIISSVHSCSYTKWSSIKMKLDLSLQRVPCMLSLPDFSSDELCSSLVASVSEPSSKMNPCSKSTITCKCIIKIMPQLQAW